MRKENYKNLMNLHFKPWNYAIHLYQHPLV